MGETLLFVKLLIATHRAFRKSRLAGARHVQWQQLIAIGACPFTALQGVEPTGMFAGWTKESQDHEQLFLKTKACFSEQQLAGKFTKITKDYNYVEDSGR